MNGGGYLQNGVECGACERGERGETSYFQVACDCFCLGKLGIFNSHIHVCWHARTREKGRGQILLIDESVMREVQRKEKKGRAGRKNTHLAVLAFPVDG